MCGFIILSVMSGFGKLIDNCMLWIAAVLTLFVSFRYATAVYLALEDEKEEVLKVYGISEDIMVCPEDSNSYYPEAYSCEIVAFLDDNENSNHEFLKITFKEKSETITDSIRIDGFSGHYPVFRQQIKKDDYPDSIMVSVMKCDRIIGKLKFKSSW